MAHPFHSAIEALDACPYPVIAALNGHAIGGGLELALTCDIRIAARGVKVGMPPAKLGLIYSHTGLRRFLDACGPEHTAELFYVGRNVDAERGREIGLLAHVVEPAELEGAAVSMGIEIASNAPLVGGRQQAHPAHPARAHRSAAGACGAGAGGATRVLLCLRELREGVRAFGEKRAPQWKGC